jgi:beta-galactosidase
VIIAEDVQKSFGDAVKLQITASKTNLFACGKDLTFIDITVVDKEGNFVANANNRVNITVEGAARLIGTDNGDSTDYEQYKTDSRRLFSGRLLAIAAANYDTGSAVVTVTSPGLEPASLTLNVLPPQDETQVIRQTLEGVVPSTADRNEIPVRNIKIDMSAFPLVKATLQPEGSSCKKLTWRATNISGVDSPLADLAVSEDGLSAEILPKGDGDLYLRCLADNGGEGIVISQTFYKLSGYGKATLNPYEFISACLYDQTVCKLGSGMERGVATTDDYCAFAYENVDFGEYGSDTIIMPVYRIDDWPLHIEIWEGMPKAEGSELIADHEYRLLNRWQVYNTVTVKLNKRLSGVTSLGFAVNGRKIHIKGFEFEKQSKVFDCMKAVDADKIYGDSFRKTADAIERIGNNVTVSFLGLEFPKAATKVTICGKAPIDNTIHLMFRDKEESLEFKASSEYCEQRFDVAVEAGKTDLHVVFLPGSNIDFKWIRFEA